jgi:hypothetical protein
MFLVGFNQIANFLLKLDLRYCRALLFSEQADLKRDPSPDTGVISAAKAGSIPA